MQTDDVLKRGQRALVAVNDRFGWQGDEDDQAWDILVHAWGGYEPDDDEDVPQAVERRFDQLVERRSTGEPLAFILGWVDFLDFRMEVKSGAFVPRLTSEFLARQAIRRLKGRRSPVHVDMATGIGPIPIGVARAVREADVYGVDISRKAVSIARANAKKLDAPNARFLKGDMFGALPQKLKGGVDVITIHPPYVPVTEVDDLPIEIKDYEPNHTLTDRSDDGLGLVRTVIYEGREWLRPGGWVLIEIIPSESRAIRAMYRDAGFVDVRSTTGELNLTRVLVGRRP